MDITDEILETIADFECIEALTKKLEREGRIKVLELITMNHGIDVDLYKRYLTVKNKVLEKWNDQILSQIDAVSKPS